MKKGNLSSVSRAVRCAVCIGMLSAVIAAFSQVNSQKSIYHFSPWDLGTLRELYNREFYRERWGHNQLTVYSVDEMFDPILFPDRRAVDVSTSGFHGRIEDRLHRVLRAMYIPRDPWNSIKAYRLQSDSTRRSYCQYAYVCSDSAQTSRTSYRILFFEQPVGRKGFQIYVDGIQEMKSAQDVEMRIRTFFAYDGRLIREKPFVENPHTWKIHSRDRKCHFRGGETTLVTTGDNPTTTVVNALAALIYAD